MVESVAAYPYLTGLRGQPLADLDALAAALSHLSLSAAANAETIESLDLNPFLVDPHRALALDAVLVTCPPTPEGLDSEPPPTADGIGLVEFEDSHSVTNRRWVAFAAQTGASDTHCAGMAGFVR